MDLQGNLTRDALEPLNGSSTPFSVEAILSRLLNNLNHPDPQQRILAIDALSDFVDVVVLDRLIDLAQNDPDSEVRGAAVLGIGEFTYVASSWAYDPEADDNAHYTDDRMAREDLKRTYAFLLSVYRDEGRSLDERRYAIESLSHFCNQTVEDLIAELYARPEKVARSSALVAMGRNCSLRWTDILADELYSPDVELQINAIVAAGECGLDACGKDLWRLTFSENLDVLLAAIWSLGQTGWEGAFDRLDELSLHPDPEVRQAADEAMEEWLLYSMLEAEYGDDEIDFFEEE